MQPIFVNPADLENSGPRAGRAPENTTKTIRQRGLCDHDAVEWMAVQVLLSLAANAC